MARQISLNFGETPVLPNNLQGNYNDLAGLVDNSALTGNWGQNPTDSSGLTDQVSLSTPGGWIENPTDPVGLTDATSFHSTWLRPQTDLSGLSDSSSLSGSAVTTTNPLVSVYQAGSNTAVVNGTLPTQYLPGMNLGSFYLGWNVTPASLPALVSYANQGMTLQVEIQTATVTTYTAIANGTNDSTIISRIKYLDGLGVPVMLALNNEMDNPTGKNLPSDSSAANYKAAANHVAQLVIDNATHGNVRNLAWFAGLGVGMPANEISFLPDINLFQDVSWDTYMTGSHAAGTTATALWQPFITTVLQPSGWTTDKVNYHISESGIVVTAFTPAQQTAWWDTVPGALAALNIKSFTYFRDNSGGKAYIATDSGVDAHIPVVLTGILS